MILFIFQSDRDARSSTKHPGFVTSEPCSKHPAKLQTKPTKKTIIDTDKISLMNREIDNEPLTEEEMQAIEKSLEEYHEGIYYTHEEVLADLEEAK